MMVEPTPQQSLVIAHMPDEHGRILAGPGTGKSWASVALLQRLSQESPGLKVRFLTFTRAATAELHSKIDEANLEGLDVQAPSTVHAFALTVLMQNQGHGLLPEPIRIPDSFEQEELIQRDIARRLRERGFDGVNSKSVDSLEREMAAGWESLDPDALMVSHSRELQNAYVGLWRQHRRVFGYSLLAEIPYQCGIGLHDYELEVGDTEFLIVDEYQDLNRAEIELLRRLAENGVKLLVIGDDDQSIYGFRMAAPDGIRDFPVEFSILPNHDYKLTVSMRCRSAILDAASTMIETDPYRERRPRLSPRRGDLPPGRYEYLRFENERDEASGVAEIVTKRLERGVQPRDIAILVRSSVPNWSRLIEPQLRARGIRIASNAWVEDALENRPLRKTIALARIALDRFDSLAWWTLIELTPGINAESVCNAVYRRAVESGNTFARTLQDELEEICYELSTVSARNLMSLVSETMDAADQMNTAGVGLGVDGWGGWLLRETEDQGISPDVERLLSAVGPRVPVDRGLGYFLSQLEPVGKDFAGLEQSAVQLMTMSASKGLTFDTVIVMGVEDGLVPHPNGKEEEERRLLYVAMTRAIDTCILTFARKRSGPTAFQGIPNAGILRGRSPLLASLPTVGDWKDGRSVLETL